MSKALCLIVVIGLSFPGWVVHADEVELKNGDRLSGRIVHKSGDVLTLQTEYAGSLKLQWSAVESIATDTAVELILIDDRHILHRFAPAPRGEGGMSGTVGAPALEIPLDRIAFIHPTPEESGTGSVARGRASVSSSTTSGNTSGTRAYGDVDYTVRGKAYRWSLSGKGTRVTDSGEETASNWLAGGDYDRFIAQDRFLYLRTSMEHDRFKDIELRTAVGGGYGLQLIETDRSKAALRGGVDYVVVDRVATANERYPALGWGVKASRRFDGGGSEIFHEQEGFWNLRERSKVTIRTRTGARAPLVENVTATLQLNVDWERRPAEDRKPTDTTLVLGLGYVF